jgi:hypothetical protein
MIENICENLNLFLGILVWVNKIESSIDNYILVLGRVILNIYVIIVAGFKIVSFENAK